MPVIYLAIFDQIKANNNSEEISRTRLKIIIGYYVIIMIIMVTSYDVGSQSNVKS